MNSINKDIDHGITINNSYDIINDSSNSLGSYLSTSESFINEMK
jgi:hypothetical protein